MYEAIVGYTGVLHHCAIIFPQRRGWLDGIVSGTQQTLQRTVVSSMLIIYQEKYCIPELYNPCNG
jgi:hypothetical protein